jgi:hypothetical protein
MVKIESIYDIIESIDTSQIGDTTASMSTEFSIAIQVRPML